MSATFQHEPNMDIISIRDFETNMIREDTKPHLAIQILTILMLGTVSIVAVAMAFNATWIAGIAVVALLFPLWMKSPAFASSSHRQDHGPSKVQDVAPQTPATTSTGNASFDAYRTDMLARLEQESKDFERFLTRLRDARDAKEFDEFMDARALKARDKTPAIDLSSKETVGY